MCVWNKQLWWKDGDVERGDRVNKGDGVVVVVWMVVLEKVVVVNAGVVVVMWMGVILTTSSVIS